MQNLERSRKFYERLGWKPSSAFADSGKIVFFQVGGAVLALYPRDELVEDGSVTLPV